MASQNWNGTYTRITFYDRGSPNDPAPETSYVASGTADVDVYNGSNGSDLVGTIDTDLMILDRSTTGPKFIGITDFFGGSGSDVISLSSQRYSYGPANLHGGDGFDLLIGNDGGDHIYGDAGEDVLKGYAGNDFLFGGADNDRLAGGRGNDVLNGDAGSDSMSGGVGDDTFFVDSAADQVFESAGGGTDRIVVVGSSSFVLASGQAIERMETNTTPSINSVNFTGNSFAQVMLGNNGNNVLNGKDGSDTMRGNGGRDSFVFDVSPNANNIDKILDFVAADDTIRLENAVFTGIGNNGTLNANLFQANATGTATQTDDRIVYNTQTGALFFDADGSNGGAAVQFALLSTKPALTNADFLVV